MRNPVKIDSKIVGLLLERLKNEFDAFYFYRNASNWCKDRGFMIASDFFAKESEDELKHAKGLENYIVDWNVVPTLPDIDSPIDFNSLPDIIEKAYNIEYKLYEDYEETSMNVFEMGDLCVFDLLQQYRTIQKQSVVEYSDMMNKLDGVDLNSKFELLMLEENLFGK